MKYDRHLTVNIFWYLLLGAFIVAIDQLSKHWAFAVGHAYYSNLCLEFIPMINRGVALSLLASSRPYVAIILVCVIVMLMWFLAWYAHWKYTRGEVIFAEVFVLAASFSNLVDRIVYGGVLDFITVTVVANFTMPIGNFADICIVIGLAYMCYELLSTWNDHMGEL